MIKKKQQGITKGMLIAILVIVSIILFGFYKVTTLLSDFNDKQTIAYLQQTVSLEELHSELNEKATMYDNHVYAELVPAEGKYIAYVYPFIHSDTTVEKIKVHLAEGSLLAAEGTRSYYKYAVTKLDKKLDSSYKTDVDIEVYLRTDRDHLIGKSIGGEITLFEQIN